MEVTTYTTFRQNLKGFIDLVINSRAPLYIKRAKGEDVVVLATAEYESMQETLHILSNPNNAQRISDALEQFEAGKGKEQRLVEE